MLHNCQQEKIAVVKIGRLDYGAVSQALYFANQVQRTFYFDFIETDLPLDDRYKLPNGGYDFDGACKQLLKTRSYRQLPRPLILMTAEPIGDTEFSSEPGWFYFSAGEEAYDPEVSIISTQPLEELPKTRTLQDYLFMMLSTHILSTYGNMAFHKEIRGCFLDYCDELIDAEHSLVAGRLCHICEQELQKRMRQTLISVEKVAAALRLMNKAVSRKYCFVVMPFDKKLDPTYEAIREALVEVGWAVKRSDEISFPRLITTQILKEILVSDIVVADLTRLNPNVFYEVGLAHAIGNDIIFLAQNKSIPFDLTNEMTIFYKPNNIEKLKSDLKRAIEVEVSLSLSAR
jgi:hypothetical protein